MCGVCAFSGGPEALALLLVSGPCALVGEGVVVGIAVCFGEEKDVSGQARLVEVNFAELRVAQAVYIVESVANICEVFGFVAGAVVGWRGGTGSTVAVAVEGVHELVPCAVGGGPGACGRRRG